MCSGIVSSYPPHSRHGAIYAQQSSSSSIVLLAATIEGPTLQFPADKQALLQPEVIGIYRTPHIWRLLEAETNLICWLDVERGGTFWRPINIT
ncbi:MAG: hypothetical protein H6638_12615 [Ardenticatenales bacterium]|nr:hypothetical protein [Ardenticatenales bacterium]